MPQASRTTRKLLRTLKRIPGAYELAALLTARRVRVRGESMWPALRPGERVLFDTLAYRLAPPRKGDVVLATHRARPGVRMIKRVAAVQGDTVGGVTLARGEFWLLGDNEDRSTDSRDLGVFRVDELVAKAWLVYWPPDRVRLVEGR